MSLNLSMRVIIKIFLSLQLLLLAFRQIIDFAGIQWLMILVNGLAVIVTLSAFFGFLKFYVSFQIFLILYNLYVIAVYGRLLHLSVTPSSLPEDDLDEKSEPQLYNFDAASRQPSVQLLSFDINSRSYWHTIVTNHISELHGADVNGQANNFLNHFLTRTATSNVHHQPSSSSGSSSFDDSLVDVCVQYIEIAIATLHILISLLGVGLILLKFKLARDKLTRNNDKTTPPLPPYTISPQMNHYMSYTGLAAAASVSSTNERRKSKLYQANDRASLRRSKRHRRSTRSLAQNRSKANSMGNLVTMRDRSGGSLRSIHRKSTTSLLLNDTIDYNNTTICSKRSGDSNHHAQHLQPQQSHHTSQRNLMLLNTSNGSNYQSLQQPSLPSPLSPESSSTYPSPPHHQHPHYQHNHHHQPHQVAPLPPPPPSYHYHNHHEYSHHQGTPGARYSTASSSYQVIGGGNGSVMSSNRGRGYLPSDSDTEFYHTFTTHAGMVNPLYGSRNNYRNDSETAI